MMVRLFPLLAFLLLCFFFGSGCLKEYSYEGGPLADTVVRPDSTPVVVVDTVATPTPAGAATGCAACEYATSLVLGAWNFRADSFFFCGSVTNAVMSPDKNAFTFFGPSACNALTGLIVTAYFDPVTFTTDRAGLVSTRVTISYYNRSGVQDVFRSGAGTQFSITINQYEHQSRTAIGRFSGTALRANDALVKLESGNFKIQFQ